MLYVYTRYRLIFDMCLVKAFSNIESNSYKYDAKSNIVGILSYREKQSDICS